YQPGKAVTVEISDVDLERRRVRLLPSDEKAQGERDAVQDYAEREQQAGLGTLADLLGGLKLDK
ncbi:MAG: 30S ribosomal protein S1, partial [Myxococcota bacterium]|nr:30S ribosomal protein S1 [Myxococcota bacterium]